MAIMLWTDEYLSGIDTIDTQHKDLFKLINSFEEENEENLHSDIIVQFAEILLSHAETHFAHEDELMVSVEYPL